MKGGRRMKSGFTLLELIVVIIIVGILATLGFTQYTKVIEQGRTAEAKAILGQLRTAQEAYNLEYGTYTTTMANLPINLTEATCDGNHYFSYNVLSTSGSATATRCASNGKTPNVATAAQYTITVTYSSGAFSGSAGYY